MRRYVIALELAGALAVLAACSRGSGEADTAEGSDQSASGSGSSDAPGMRIRVVLAGGPDAGTHESTPPGSACIPYQSAALNGLGAAYFSADTAPKGIAYVDFGTKERVPTAAPTDSFSLRVRIGTNHYEIRPEQQSGTGKLTVTGRSPRYTAMVTGKTAEGIGVDATLECLR